MLNEENTQIARQHGLEAAEKKKADNKASLTEKSDVNNTLPLRQNCWDLAVKRKKLKAGRRQNGTGYQIKVAEICWCQILQNFSGY